MTQLSRRALIGGLVAASLPTISSAFTDAMLQGPPDGRYVIPEQMRARRLDIQPGSPVGSIHIVSEKSWLFFITAPTEAIWYPIGVGRAGRSFLGSAYVGRKAHWPSWTPTANMVRQDPEIYGPVAGGLPGGPSNPLGARALYLYRDGRDTLYRIHGTSQPWGIGRDASTGCIRMFNQHVMDLYERVPVGTTVYAT